MNKKYNKTNVDATRIAVIRVSGQLKEWTKMLCYPLEDVEKLRMTELLLDKFMTTVFG